MQQKDKSINITESGKNCAAGTVLRIEEIKLMLDYFLELSDPTIIDKCHKALFEIKRIEFNNEKLIPD